MDNNYQDAQVLNMVNRKKEQYNKAITKSTQVPQLKYKTRKKKSNISKSSVIATIVTISLAITILLTAFPTKYEKAIKEKVDNYIEIMKSTADKQTSIETSLGRNYENTDELVDYTDRNIENLANHLITAGQNSEIDLRCAVLAAYKVINEPYRESVLNQSIAKANDLEKENPIANSVNPILGSNLNDYLENIGHDNLKEYNDEERNELIELAEQIEKELKKL